MRSIIDWISYTVGVPIPVAWILALVGAAILIRFIFSVRVTKVHRTGDDYASQAVSFPLGLALLIILFVVVCYLPTVLSYFGLASPDVWTCR